MLCSSRQGLLSHSPGWPHYLHVRLPGYWNYRCASSHPAFLLEVSACVKASNHWAFRGWYNPREKNFKKKADSMVLVRSSLEGGRLRLGEGTGYWLGDELPPPPPKVPVWMPHLQKRLFSENPVAPMICPITCTSAMVLGGEKFSHNPVS